MSPQIPEGHTRCGLIRRLAAIIYDGLLLVALLFIAAFAALPFTHGQATGAYNPYLMSWLFLVAFAFFAWFWTHGGQTLGMRAWRIRVVDYSGKPVGLWQALLRFMMALPMWAAIPLGLYFWRLRADQAGYSVMAFISWAGAATGFLWPLIDRSSLAWQDRFSNSQLVVLPKPQKR